MQKGQKQKKSHSRTKNTSSPHISFRSLYFGDLSRLLRSFVLGIDIVGPIVYSVASQKFLESKVKRAASFYERVEAI